MTRAEAVASRKTHRVVGEARAILRSAEGPARAILAAAIDVMDRAEQLADELGRYPYLTCEAADGFDRNFVCVDTPADRAECWKAQPVAYALTMFRLALSIGNALAGTLLDANNLEAVG